MTIFQKLFWLRQMGIRVLCQEKPRVFGSSCHKGIDGGQSLGQLDQKLVASKSSLSATATHPLGGIGPVPAKVMCVLEMPTAAEDRTGVPLSGEEGALFQKMLGAVGLDIKTQTYVAYLSPWRSPGARVLTGVETQEGLALLKERIQLVKPEVLLLLGIHVVQALLGVPLGQARTKVHDWQGIPVFATFAPGFLMKNPAYKKGAWVDLQKLQSHLENKK